MASFLLAPPAVSLSGQWLSHLTANQCFREERAGRGEVADKPATTGPTPRVSDSACRGWGTRICFLNKSPGGKNAGDWTFHSKNHQLKSTQVPSSDNREN